MFCGCPFPTPDRRPADMGTVSSRGYPLAMPGSLSIEASQGFSDQLRTPNSPNDDADVIDQRRLQEEKHNHSGSLKPSDCAAHCESLEPDEEFGPTPPIDQETLDTCRAPPTPPLVSDDLKSQHTEESSESSCSSSSPSTPPLSIPIPPLPDMSNLKLHSPSTNIVGTPFATNLTRFEYPFPPSQTGSSATSQLTSPASSSVSIANSSPSMTPFVPASTTLVDPITLSLVMPLPGELAFSRNCTELSLAHPKLRATTPPVPPSLLKKRKERQQARRMTVDNAKKFGHDQLHHAYSDGNLHAHGKHRKSVV